MTAFDYSAKAESRIVSQYRDKPKFNAWVKIIPRLADAYIEPVIQELISSYNPDTAENELLNVIGRIVGIPRPIVRVATTDVFGYDGNPSYVNYNLAPYVGDGGEVQDLPLSDDLYRKLVKAKIARNISDGTYDSTVKLTEFILGFSVTALIDYGDMSFQMGFEREPDANTKFLLENFEVVPRPQGVRLREYFVLPKNIDAIEAASESIYNYANYTLPGDVS